MRNYSHDMHGALQAGYARRARAALVEAAEQAAGWISPYNHGEVPADKAYRFVHSLLLDAARAAGVPESELLRWLENESRPHQGENRDRYAQRVARDAEAGTLRIYEDPTNGASWAAYDAHVDSMDLTDARKALKVEARLRASAQYEAARNV